MKLKKIRISYMDHPQALKFYDEVITSLSKAGMIPFGTLLDDLKKSVAIFRNSFYTYNRNQLIRRISLEQRNLQHNLMSVKYRLKKNLESQDGSIVNLSEKAIIILKYYCTSRHVSVKQKDDKIFNVVDALEDFMTERERMKIGINTYLKNLKKINLNLKVLIESRDAIPVVKSTHNLMPDRHRADCAYREIISFLNLLFRKNPEDTYLNDLLEELNHLITQQSERIYTQIHTSKTVSSTSSNMGVA